MPEKPQRQMTKLDVVETSGVDHPAHGIEGWLVRKSAGPGRRGRLEAILKGTSMPTKKEELVADVQKSALPDAQKEFITKALDLTEDIDAAAALWQSLRAKSEKDDPSIPTPSDAAAAAGAAPLAAAAGPDAAALGADVFKSLGLDADTEAALQKAAGDNPAMLKAFGAIAGKATEALAKAAQERDERLDAEAIAKSRDNFKHVAIDHATVAPMLRKMALVDPEGAAQLTEALEKAEGSLAQSGLFSEVGHRTPAAGTAMEKATALAQGHVASGAVKTISEGLTKAFSENPDLYIAHEKENS